MMKTVSLYLILLSAIALQAQPTEYFDFISWNSAVSSVTHSDNFESVSSDQSFRTAPYNGNGFTMYSVDGATYTDGNVVDATPLNGSNPVDNNGTNHARMRVVNSGSNQPLVWVTLRFDQPATAFYAEFEDHASNAGVRVELYDTTGTKVVWHNLHVLGRIPSTADDRNYGFILDPSGDPLDSIRFVADGTSVQGEIFSMDNLSMALLPAPAVASSVPTLSEWSIILLTLLLMIISINYLKQENNIRALLS